MAHRLHAAHDWNEFSQTQNHELTENIRRFFFVYFFNNLIVWLVLEHEPCK